MSSVPRRLPHLKIFLISAIIAAMMLGVFYAGCLAIPSFTRRLFQAHLAERVSMQTVPDLLRRRERLDEVRHFLNGRIAAHSIHDMVYAYRARLEAIEHGSEQGFRYLVELIEKTNLPEQTGQWRELAALAAQAGRWNDFYEIAMMLSDYGETQRVKEMMEQLQQQGKPVADTLFSDAGAHFYVYSGWNQISPMALPPDQTQARAFYALWNAEQRVRFKNVLDDAITSQTLLKYLPDDPRQQAVMFYAARPKDKKAAFAWGGKPLLQASDFSVRGKPLQDKSFLAKAAYEAKLPQAVNAPVYMLCSTTSVLQVFPIVFIRSGENLSVHYLPYTRAFPELISFKGLPGGKFSISFANDLASKVTGQDRNITFLGLYAIYP